MITGRHAGWVERIETQQSGNFAGGSPVVCGFGERNPTSLKAQDKPPGQPGSWSLFLLRQRKSNQKKATLVCRPAGFLINRKGAAQSTGGVHTLRPTAGGPNSAAKTSAHLRPIEAAHRDEKLNQKSQPLWWATSCPPHQGDMQTPDSGTLSLYFISFISLFACFCLTSL